MLCASWMEGEFVGEWIHVYLWLSPFAVQLKLSQRCSLTIPQNKIKNLKKKERVHHPQTICTHVDSM